MDPTTNKNISLSSDEYALYLEISNELADLFPQLVSGFDSQGNAMLKLSGNAETATSQLEALIEQERQLADFKISQNLPDQFAGIVEQNKILQNNLDKHQKDIERYTNLQNIVRGNQDLESLGFKLTGGDKELGNYQIKLDSDFEGADELNRIFKEAALDAGVFYNQTFQDSILDPETNKVVSQWWTDLDFVTADQYEKFKESFSALLTESDIDISGKLSEAMLLANQDIKEIQANWNSIIPSLINSMSLYSDYNEFDESIQQLISNAIGNIDFQSLTDEQIKAAQADPRAWLRQLFIEPIAGMDDETRNLFNDILAVYDDAALSIAEKEQKIKELRTVSENDTKSAPIISNLLKALGLTYDGTYTADVTGGKLDEIMKRDNNLLTRDELKTLNDQEFEIAYDLIINEGKSFSTLDALLAAIEKVKEAASKTTSEFESFKDLMNDSSETSFSTKVDNYQTAVSTLDEAISSMRSGTYTNAQKVDLLQQYPNIEEFIDETGNLQAAAEKLKASEFGTIMQTINDQISTFAESNIDTTGLEALRDNLLATFDVTSAATDELKTQLRDLVMSVTQNLSELESKTSIFDQFLSGLSDEDIEIFYKYVQSEGIDLSKLSEEGLKTTLEAALKIIPDKEAANKDPLTLLGFDMNALQADAQKIQDSMSLKEAKGLKSSVSDYQKLIKNSDAQIWNLRKQNIELQKQLVGLDETSEAYQSILSQINSNASSINSAKIAQLEWNEAASRLNYEPGEGLTAYNKAKETRNAGDNYLDMMAGLKEAKEAYDKGLIGTDDFKEYARMISPSGATDPENFLENYGKVSKWFTEGTSGVKKFLNELKSKDLAEFNEETQTWTYNIKDMAKAANEMGVSEEVLTAMFGRLQDYGFDNNYVSSVEDGVQRLSNLYGDLAKEEARLKEMESSKGEYSQEQIDDKKELIQSIKDNITGTKESLSYVTENAGEAANAQIESAKAAIESLAQQRKEILENNEYGENTQEVVSQLEKQMAGLAEENGLQLDLEFNVVGKEELEESTDALEKLRDSGKITIDLDFNKADMSADELQTKIDELTRTKATIDITSPNGEEALDEINALIASLETEKKIKIALESGTSIEELLGLGDEELETKLGIDDSEIDSVKQRLQQLTEETQIPITVQIEDEQFNQLVETEKTVDVDSSSADEAQAKLDKINATKLSGKSFYVSSNTNSVVNSLSSLISHLRAIDGTSVSFTVNRINRNTSSGDKDGVAYGTITPALASGTAYNMLNLTPAYANGRNISLDHNENALVNELGTEGLIRDGKLFEIPGGMHFQSLKKGDIILSAKQMADLMSTGKASGRGKAYADGTIGNIPLMSAYGGSTVGGGSFKGGAATSSSTSNLGQAISKLGSASSGTTQKVANLESALEELDKLFDWIEVKLDRVQKDIDYDTALSENAVGYSNKNKYLTSAQGNTQALIDANTKGAKAYKAQADKAAKKVGLSKDLYNRIKDGTIKIQSLSEDDKKRVDAVKQWYDKMLDCQQAIEDLKASQRDLAQQKLDNIVDQYDAMLSHIEHSANLINGFVDQAELKGLADSTVYYDALIKNAESSISEMQKERTALLQSLQESVNSGIITVGSVEWYDMQGQINDVTESIQEANTSILEFRDNIRQITWDRFDKVQEAIGRLTDEADFLIDLMSNDDLFDDKGFATKQGMATFGLHGQNYNVLMEQANQYRDEMNRINAELQKNENKGNTKLIERREELLDLQRESILAAEDEKQAIKDLVKDGIEKELDALKDLIDKYTEALDSQKDLNDYQKEVSDKAKEVASIQKQLKAYENDTSEEGRAKRQELQKSLKEAQEDLNQTEYDKYISDQKDLLDDLYTEYEDTLNQRLDNIDQLIADMIQEINNNSYLISETLRTESESVGYTLTSEMDSIWGVNGSATGILSTYSDNFSNTMTTVQTTINGIENYLSQLVAISNEQANKNVNTSTTSNSENPSVSGKTVTQASSSAGTNSGNKNAATDDEIVKIIKSGNSNKNTIAKERKAKNHSALWKYIVDKYGHIPTYAIYEKLGKKLGVKAPKKYRVASETNALLKALKKKGYASGTPSVLKEDDYWTNENGQEYVIRKSDGAVLQRLFPGDKVLNADASENMYNFATNPSQFLSGLNMGNIPSASIKNANTSIGDVNVSINLPNVTQYEEFAYKLQHDKNFEKMIQDMTIGRINGKSQLNKYKTKF